MKGCCNLQTVHGARPEFGRGAGTQLKPRSSMNCLCHPTGKLHYYCCTPLASSTSNLPSPAKSKDRSRYKNGAATRGHQATKLHDLNSFAELRDSQTQGHDFLCGRFSLPPRLLRQLLISPISSVRYVESSHHQPIPHPSKRRLLATPLTSSLTFVALESRAVTLLPP